MDNVLTLIDGPCIDIDVKRSHSRMHRWIWINDLTLIYDAYLDWCKDDSLFSFHGCTNGWTPKWFPYGESPHGKTLCGEIQSGHCLVMVVKMDVLHSGPLMVKYLTGRGFAVKLKVVIVFSWLYKWMNSKVVPLWWNPSWEDALWWTPKWSPYGESPHRKTLCGWVILEVLLSNPSLIVE